MRKLYEYVNETKSSVIQMNEGYNKTHRKEIGNQMAPTEHNKLTQARAGSRKE